MLVALFLLALTCALQQRCGCWRRAFAFALVGCALVAVGLTVLPSLINALRFATVAIGWAIGCAVVITFGRATRRDSQGGLFSDAGSLKWGLAVLLALLWAGVSTSGAATSIRTACAVASLLILTWLAFSARPLHERQTPVEREEERSIAFWLPVGLILLMLIVTLVAAAASVPRVYDALAYHMPRVFYWTENASAAFYPTPEPRQNFISPFTSYMAVQLLLLHDHDGLALMTQWVAYLGTILMASLLAQRLGAGRSAQIWVAAMVATVPNLALQAQTALSDVVTTLWILVVAWMVTSSKRGACWDFLLGAVVGLAILSKASAAIALAPFGIWWAFRRLRSVEKGWRWRNLLIGALCASSSFLAVHGYHFLQSQLAYGKPIYSAGSSYLYETHGPRTAIASLLEHASSQLVLPVTTQPVRLELGNGWNQNLERVTRWAESLLGVDPDSDNLPPGLPYSLSLDSAAPPTANSPQSTGNPLHFVLGILAVGVTVLTRGGAQVARLTSLCAVSGSLLLVALFRWQPWIARFHLPLLVLATVLVGTHLLARRPAWLRSGVLVLSAVLIVPFTIFHQEQPLTTVVSTPKRDLYLQADLVWPLASSVSEAQSIGLLAPNNVILYPFLRAARESAPDAKIAPVFAELPWRGGVKEAWTEPAAILLVTQYSEPRPEHLELLEQGGYREVLVNAMGRAYVRR